ncbi:hypothetical protein [Caballeronia sp. M23-90]
MVLRISGDRLPPPCGNCGATGQTYTRRQGRIVSWCGVCDPHCAWCFKSLPNVPDEIDAHINRCTIAAIAFFGFDSDPQMEQVIDLKNRPFDLDTE